MRGSSRPNKPHLRLVTSYTEPITTRRPKQRNNLRLVTSYAKPSKVTTRRPNQRDNGNSKAQTRAELLAMLRRQSSHVGGARFTRLKAPELFDLATAAASASGSFVKFGGIRFPLKFGIWRYVVDPETGATLLASKGVWL